MTDIATTLRGERMRPNYTGSHERPSHDEIARLAHQLYERRRDGHDVDDWLFAERVLTSTIASRERPRNVCESDQYRKGHRS